MNDQAKVTDARVSARRRLLRGAFSAPAVLTLYSGGAMAAASNQRCLVNQAAAPIAAPPVSNAADTYLRVQLRVSGATYYVLGNSLPVNRILSLPTNSQAQVFDIGLNKLTGSPIATPGGLALAPKWAALRVNSSGVVQTVGNTNSNGTALFNSCWNSFVLGA